MTLSQSPVMGIFEIIKESWFLIAFVGGMIYWAARQESALAFIQKDDARITALENRTMFLESGFSDLKINIDLIKEDLQLIKMAVIK